MRIKCPKCAGIIPFEAGELPPSGLRCTCPTCGKSMHLMPRAAWGAERNLPSGGEGAAERLWAAHGLEIDMHSGLTRTPGPSDAFGLDPEPPPSRRPPPEPAHRTWLVASIGMILVLLGLAVAAGVIVAGASPSATMAAGR